MLKRNVAEQDDYSWASPETRKLLEEIDRRRRRANFDLAFSGFAVVLSLVAVAVSLLSKG